MSSYKRPDQKIKKWVEGAEKRIVNILTERFVMSQSMLVAKISEAGPKRFNPHIVNQALNKLVSETVLIKKDKPFENKVFIPCYHLKHTDQDLVSNRLNELFPYLDWLKNNKNQNHNKFHKRLGYALEIPVGQRLNALVEKSEKKGVRLDGEFKYLSIMNDGEVQCKKEPPQIINRVKIKGRMDFILKTGNDTLVIECKNVRNWIYPNNHAFKKALWVALDTDAILVYIARRHHPVMNIFRLAGIITHDTHHQIYPYNERDMAEQIRNKDVIGYHDICISEENGEKRYEDFKKRLDKFINTNLLKVASKSRKAFDLSKDYLRKWLDRKISLTELYQSVKENRRLFHKNFIQNIPEDIQANDPPLSDLKDIYI